jgi:hypothetical protein
MSGKNEHEKAEEGQTERSNRLEALKKRLADAEMREEKREDGARRPPDNPDFPIASLQSIMEELNGMRLILETGAEHLRGLDRKRLNGVGIKKLGFIEEVADCAQINPEFFPHFLTINNFRNDDQRYRVLEKMRNVTAQIDELVFNMRIIAADILYTDACEYYYSVKEAARRRVDASEAIFARLFPFFKKRRAGEGETKKKLVSDFKKAINGKGSFKIGVESRAPRQIAAEVQIFDEKLADAASFKETEKGEIKE